MTSRERVQTALAHQEPDRVPLDLGGTCVSSIHVTTYAALRAQLGLPSRPVRTLEAVQQIAAIDDDVMDALGLDVLPVFSNALGEFRPTPEPGGSKSFKDDFGATLRMLPNGYYYDWQEFPLAEPSIDDLNRMLWPDPANVALYAGLRQATQELRRRSDKALFGMAPCGHDLFNQIMRVRGMENGLCDLLVEVDFAEAFFDRLTETICTAQRLFLSEVGDLIDVHFAADDLAHQTGPLIAPEVWRRLVKPRQAKIMQTIKAHTKAPVFYHSCGAVVPFLDDLIEIGVDILNPVQVSAAGMDADGLKRRYGKRLSFWGGGCDTQRVLPRGTVQEVRDEVRRRIGQLAPGGGFVFNPVHNIQPLVPPENVVAMFRAAAEFGDYPNQRGAT